MVQRPHADPGQVCPLHKKDMSKVCHTCPWWQHLQGSHPQTGEHIDQWSCAIAWLPMLMVELRAGMNGTQAAVESFRNEMVKFPVINLDNILPAGEG